MDLFRVESDGKSIPIVYFQDFGIEAGYETRSSSRYEIIGKNIEPFEDTYQFI